MEDCLRRINGANANVNPCWQLLKNFDWAIADPFRGIDSIGQGVCIQSSAPNRPYNPGRDLSAWPGRPGLVGLVLPPSRLGKRDAGEEKKRNLTTLSSIQYIQISYHSSLVPRDQAKPLDTRLPQ
jgi:hypothetical protein